MVKSHFPPRLLVSSLSYLLVLLLLFLPGTAAQTYMNMTRGTSLSSSGPNSYMTSQSGDFAFGFRAYNSSDSLFLLAIWFKATSPNHIIWYAMNGENPILAPKNSTLRLNQDGSLTLISPDGNQIWRPKIEDADHATLLDSSNFVICDATTQPIWESFQYPTDTVVPGQNLSSGQQLWSKLTDSNFSQGRFTLIVQSFDGNLVLYPVNYYVSTRDEYHAIWAAGHYKTGDPYCGQLVFNSNGSLYCNNSQWVNFTLSPTLSPLDYYQHATLDPDGLFRMYAYPKRNNNAVGWQVTGTNLADGCRMWANTQGQGGGVCGVNGLCDTGSNNQTRLECKCPPDYSLVYPDNIYMGCKPDLDVEQYCDSSHEATEFEFIEFDHADWLSPNYEWYASTSEDQCRASCLEDCFCTAVIFTYASNGSGVGCSKKLQPLQFGINGTDVYGKAFIKVPKSNPKNVGRNLFFIGGAVVFGASSLLLVLVALFVSHLWHTSKKSRMELSMSWPNLRVFTYKELNCATKNFQEELGHGTFGIVYKGLLSSDPPTAIAVKKLELLNDGEREFESEVRSIGQSHHKNLVKLIGFCDEGSNRMLVYEYMSKGSLEKFIKVGGERLDWDKRAKVALGIAKGLQYLHEDCNSPVIHCDIKPQNILLDDKFVAKIADFGVSKLLGIDQTHTTTFGRGTFGYIAPEWTSGEQITSKVDAYSFGVLLLEIIFCRVGIAQQAIRDVWADKMSQAVKLLKEQLLEDMGDVEDEANIQNMQKFVEVAVACLQVDPSVRPTMRDVAYWLARAIYLRHAPTDTIPPPEPFDAI